MGYRALVLVTQTTTSRRAKFYAALGCEIEGIRDMYYTNRDIERGEVAIFWSYKLIS
jgi:hypothetical protein